MEIFEKPEIIVLPEAWHVITAELERAAHDGETRCGSPDEAVFIPLCALHHHPGSLHAPRLEQTYLRDLKTLVIAEALIPPRELVELSAARIRFRSNNGNWRDVQEHFDAMIEAATAKYPRLDVLARGHSHPFDVAETRPSAPDRSEHLAPCLHYNRALGLNAGFTFIGVRANSSDCREPGVPFQAWALQCFACTTEDDLVGLGLAKIPEASGDFAAHRKPPFYLTEEGRRFEAEFNNSLGGAMKIERLPLGWSRYRIDGGTARMKSVLALPPDFSRAPGRRFVYAEGSWAQEDVIDWSAYLPLPRRNMQEAPQ